MIGIESVEINGGDADPSRLARRMRKYHTYSIHPSIIEKRKRIKP